MTTLTGAEALVEMLKAHGVEVLFGLCGDTSLPLYDALSRNSLRHVLTRDERHAAYMADGYARVTGKVGVCEGPSGGGATYILPGLAEANESSIPVLAINTDISVTARNRFTLTELDQGALMKPLTKWNAVLERSADIPRAVRAAFDAMTSGRPGAAHLALPFDVQNGPVERADVWADPTLGAYPSRRVAPDPFFVVVVGLAQERLGVAVDDLLGQQDIVVKPLGKALHGIRGIAGATDLGDLHTVLVLDVGAIIEDVTSGELPRDATG